MSTQPVEGNALLNVAGAAAYLGVTDAFVRRLVLEKRVRYFKVGKFVRFRIVDLDAFVEAGRQDPVELRVHVRSTQRRGVQHANMQRRSAQSPRRDKSG